jgi:tetratricopeptide (TPR) repeat protein
MRRQSLREAIRIDPTFARAHAALADTLALRWDDENVFGRYGQRDSPKFAEIHREISRALELDPKLAEAHAALGGVLLDEWKFADAQAALRRAIELNPNYATAHHWLARALARMAGSTRPSRSWSSLPRWTLCPTVSSTTWQRTYSLSGRTADALAVNERALAIAPNSGQALGIQGDISRRTRAPR